MGGKRPIDSQRDAAITLHIGGDDKSPVKEVLSTGDNMYVINDTGVFKIQLADHIDPGRTNPSIPNLSQQVLTAGHNNEIVARILLTAKYLFDERNATVKPFVSSLFEKCIVLTQQLLELDAMGRELADEIVEKAIAFAQRVPVPNAFSLPSVPGMNSKVHNILIMADKAKDSLLAICRLQFLPDPTRKPTLQELDSAVAAAMMSESELVKRWGETAKYLRLIRNMRNASEHRKEGQGVLLTDFAMRPDGQVYPPLVEIQHAETPIRELPLNELLEFVRHTMIEHAEVLLTFIRHAGLLKDNPLRERVAEVPESQRRHRFVRYYRVVSLNGAWQILA